MAQKQDRERLLKKGLFTGLEAARLIIGHHVEQDHDRPGFLSDREISYIKSRLTSQSAAEYNRWIDTYRIIDRTLQEAHVLALEIILGLTQASRELDRYFVEYLLEVISGVHVMEEAWKKPGFSSAEAVHQAVHTNLRSQLRNYLGLKSIMESVSDMLGVDFAEDLREWYSQIEQQVGLYNNLIRRDTPYARDMPKLRKLRIDTLTPSASSLRYFRERIALGLGAGWQEAAKELVAIPDEEEEQEEVTSGQEA